MPLITISTWNLSTYIDGNLDAPYLLLCLPGFLDSGNYAHMEGHRAYFAERGWLCVSFDPPGTFASSGIYTVTNYLHAVDELIAYFGNKPTVILGHSLGGSIALLASFSNRHVTKTISIMSPHDLRTHFSKRIGTDRQVIGFRSGTRDMPDPDVSSFTYTVPRSFVEDAMQYDMLDKLQQSKKPKLFITGHEDALVDPTLVETGYLHAGSPKQFNKVNSHNHSYRYNVGAIEEINQLVEEFII